MADGGLEMVRRRRRIAPAERDLPEVEPGLGKVLPRLEGAAEGGFGAVEVEAAERGQPEEVVGAPEAGVERDRLAEPLFGGGVVAGAPVEVAELQQGLRVVRREAPVAFVSGAGRPEPLLAEERRPEVGEDRRVLAVAELQRAFEFRLRLGPVLDAQQQPAEKAPQARFAGRQRNRLRRFFHRFPEPPGAVQHRSGEIGSFVTRGRRPGGGRQLDERFFRPAELTERLAEGEPGVREAGGEPDRRPQVRERPRRVPAEEPEGAGPVEGRRIVRAGGEEGGQRGGGFVGLARLDPRRRLRERRLGRRLPPGGGRQQRRGQRDERRRPDPTGTPPTGNPPVGNPRVGDPHEAESARTPMFPSRRIPGKHRPRRAPDYAVLPAALGLAALLLPGCGDEPPAEAAPEAAPEEILPVGGAIRRPARVRFEPPRYPESARERGEEALVVLELTLDRDGAVAAARSLRGPEDLATAAVAAARSWAYEPTLVEGEPAALRFAETVRFVLRPAGGQGMRLPAGAGPRASGLRESGPPGVPARFPDWEISGHAFTACPCDTPCPCRSNGPPSHPPCHATTATRITAGRYGEVELAGAEFVTLGPESWVALYLDEELDEPRRRAILGIFRSLAPGAPQRYRAIRRVPLSITEAAAGPGEVRRRAVIPGILEMETTLRLENGRLAGRIPGMDVWSNEIAYGRTGAYRFHDPGIPAAWDHGGRQSNAKEFTLDLGMYREGRMLIQHADGSGDWTDPQRALFSCARGSRR